MVHSKMSTILADSGSQSLERVEEEQHRAIRRGLQENSRNFRNKLKAWHSREVRSIDATRQKLDYALHRPPPRRAAQI